MTAGGCDLHGTVPDWLQLKKTNLKSDGRSILHVYNNHFSGMLPLNATNDKSNNSNLIVLGNRFRKLNNGNVPLFINYKFKNIRWMFVSNEDIIFSFISTILLSFFGLLIINYKLCQNTLFITKKLKSIKQSFDQTQHIVIMSNLRKIIRLIINLFIVIHCLGLFALFFCCFCFNGFIFYCFFAHFFVSFFFDVWLF